ncbi:LuxR family transcriptional regulator [Rhodococcus oryzae]|uniref:LuxR family transcriptional regulator n=1 Tax=Rhodococcus oryzae TaxID=2571143 RepID=A0ABY2RN59_9NOCA|nr:LuxR family transcriptional regulator [Rhodococcus oryzae]
MPGAQAFLAAARTGNPHMLIRGTAGSGKSILLAAIRDELRANGTPVAATASAELEPGGALVVDDAHRLPDAAVDALTLSAHRPDITVIVATEPRPHSRTLRSLGDALGSLTLDPMTARDIVARAESTLGVRLPIGLAAAVLRITGGGVHTVDAALGTLSRLDPTEPRTQPALERALDAATAAHLRARLGELDSDLLCTLSIAAIGSGPDPAELVRVLSVDPALAQDLIDRARGTGLVTHTLLPVAREPLAAVLGAQRLARLHADSLRAKLADGTLDLPAARAYGEAGVTDPDLAEFLCGAAEHAEPALAASLYAEAVRAGADRNTLALRWSEAAALSADLDTAVGLTDGLLERAADLTDTELAAAVRIAASVAAQQGMLGRSADLYEWLGPARVGSDAPIAATVLLAAGRPEQAEAMTDRQAGAPPTSTSAGAALLAQGLRQSIDGHVAIAVNSLTRGLSLSANGSRPRLLPDSGAAITALAGIACGELAGAQAVLQRALDTEPRESITRHRHELLLTWIAMVRGDLDAATARLDAMPTDAEPTPRDALFIAALRVGLARRVGDIGALTHSWERAHGVIAEHSADLFSLLPLGELWLGAARLRDTDRLAHLIEQANELLTRLGEPTLWGSPLHWYGVQAAILAESPAELLPHANALGVAAETSPYAAGLAAAGRAWLRVLQGEIDAAVVEQSARTLDRIGLPWDGARLASEAALRASDTRTATTLLQVARSLRPAASSTPGTVAGTERELSAGLTDREAEVANLLVMGLTYRDIGARLFISAKTVEHHVARIRRRLDATSRADMLSMLRAMGHGTES